LRRAWNFFRSFNFWACLLNFLLLSTRFLIKMIIDVNLQDTASLTRSFNLRCIQVVLFNESSHKRSCNNVRILNICFSLFDLCGVCHFFLCIIARTCLSLCLRGFILYQNLKKKITNLANLFLLIVNLLNNSRIRSS